MDFLVDFSADELFDLRRGMAAARKGDEIDLSESAAWRAGWYLAAGTDFVPRHPRWVETLSEALAPVCELEVA